MIFDVIIIGSGPAGYTAALYTARAALKTLLLTGLQPGGQLTTTTEVDNFPGFEKGILGPQLMEIMMKQVKRFGTEVVGETAKQLIIQKSKVKNTSQNSKVAALFEIITDSNQYLGKTVIVATGASAKYLGLPSEERLKGKGVSGCATCDGFFFRGKDVAVIGGGDTAMEEASFLTRFAERVYIVHRRSEFRASAVMLKRAEDNPKIEFLTNKTTLEVLGENAVTGLKLKDNQSGEISDLAAQGVFLAIGHKPNTGFVKDILDLDEKGYIKTVLSKSPLEPHTATKIPGLFAAGDCVDPKYRQAIVAAGSGCQAALDAQYYLEES
jgi:thioredoxin reductase (NADPH)